jgi:hypothetical protein
MLMLVAESVYFGVGVEVELAVVFNPCVLLCEVAQLVAEFGVFLVF